MHVIEVKIFSKYHLLELISGVQLSLALKLGHYHSPEFHFYNAIKKWFTERITQFACRLPGVSNPYLLYSPWCKQVTCISCVSDCV